MRVDRGAGSPATRTADRTPLPSLRSSAIALRDIDEHRRLLGELRASCARAASSASAAPRERRGQRARARPRAGAASRVWVLRPARSVQRPPRAAARARRRRRRSATRRRSGDCRHSRQRVGERDQMAGEIAAVDGGNILRARAARRSRVSYQLKKWPRKRAMRAIVASVASSRSTVSSRADPAEVARADDGEQIEADVGRRGAMRDDRRRVLLEIVRRQHVVVRR